MKKSAITTLLVLLVVLGTWAKNARLDEKRDAALQTIWIKPHNPPQATEREGRLLGVVDYKWLFYPYIGRSFDESRKWFQVAIELRGPNETVLLPGSDLTLMVDGKQTTVSGIFVYNVGGNGCSDFMGQLSCVNHWEIAPKTDEARAALESWVRALATAHEVYVTMVGGSGTNRFSVRLTGPQLAVFQAVLDEYDKPDMRH